MATRNWSEIKARKLTPAQIEEIRKEAEAEVLSMNLRELREAAGKTQVEAATLAEMSQGELSRAERRDDHLMSTLRRYVEALGGELEVFANIGGQRVRLKGV